MTNQWLPTCPDDRPPLLTLATTDSGSQTEVPEKPLESAQLEALAGEYQRNPVLNDWHIGAITIEKRDNGNTPTELRWTNRAGKSWPLFPSADGPRLRTGKGNPYHQRPAGQAFHIAFDPQGTQDPPQPAGFWFENGLFLKQ